MNIPYPNLVSVRAEILLDAVDSKGRDVFEMVEESARPMALAIGQEPVWYGFVMNDESVKRIAPGSFVVCCVSFLNHDGAREVFPVGASILFGDGFSSRGVIRITGFD